MRDFSRNSSGNILFIILIAVALFAALTYAVTQASRSSGSNAGAEKMDLDISNMLQYSSGLRQAVIRVMLGNGCAEDEISVYAPRMTSPSNYNNIKSPSDRKCHIFEAPGGAVVWQKPPLSAQQAGGVEYNIDGGVGVIDVGLNVCAATELMLYTYVSREMCIAINTKLGVPNPSGEPPVQNTWNKSIPAPNHGSFTGGFGCGVHLGSNASNTLQLRGLSTGCFFVSGQSRYYYYDVLLAR